MSSENLETALNRTLPTRRRSREAAFEQEDFAALRADLQERKREAIDRLPELVEEFKETAEQAGATVHMAATPEDALAIVGELIQRHGVKLAVKSKSMATEEIGLNEYLEERGVEVVETDLGEWIVQLAGEKPSHLITPALHKTREEIAELFSRVTGEEVPPDIPQLVAVARRRLRQSFIDADMGITGANVAIAETGSIVIVSNEGNARLVSTLPPVHVAILGIEKVVATLDDATSLLRVLSKSGTGQRVTSYISYITGPSRTADIELSLTIGVHGPKEVHIILLDNRRGEMRDRPEFRDALDCIRCGACLNACPPFQAVGGHVFGYRYTGPIGLVLTNFHHGGQHAEGPVSLCVQCNACEPVCPAGIDIPRMILDLRMEYNEGASPGLVKGKLLDFLTYKDPGDPLISLARWGQRLMPRGGRGARLPLLGRWRGLPSLPDKSFLAGNGLGTVYEPAPKLATEAIGTTAVYFPGCLTDNLFPSTGEAAVRALTGCGVRVRLPAEQVCCGLAHMNAGDRRTAIANAKKTIAMLEREEADWIVSTSASCVVAMTQDYPHLLRDEPAWRARAEALAGRITDFATYFERVVRLPAGALTDADAPSVTYHDSCQSSNCLNLGPEPRRLLEGAMGLELREMEESSMCCGFGGAFSLEYPKVSQRILQHKLDHIEATGAPLVVTDNPGCIMQIQGGLEAGKKDVRVLHLAELLAQRLDLLERT
ncbi:MAG: LUD domain-containing protein [Dehalococcoidia bacterium]